MYRERSRSVLTTSKIDGRPPHFSQLRVYERLSEKSLGRKSINPVSHSFIQPYSGPWVKNMARNELYIVSQYVPVIDTSPFETEAYKLKNSLDRPALQTSSKFGLLQNIAELDDTIANFTIKYWKSVKIHESYAAVKWGTLPMVSDLRNMLKQVQKIGSVISTSGSYESVRNVGGGYTYQAEGETFRIDYTTTVRQSGVASLPESQLTQGWLDYFGLHPDLKTAWDLVPLSFVVDWFVPVSKFLDAFKEQGWVTSALFDGCISTKTTFSISHVSSASGFFPQGMRTNGKIYKREKVQASLSVLPDDFEAVNNRLANLYDKPPTLTNVADAVYLGALSRRK